MSEYCLQDTYSSIAFFSLCLQNNVYNMGREKEKERERHDKHFSLSIDRSKTDQRYRSTFNEMLMYVRFVSIRNTFRLFRRNKWSRRNSAGHLFRGRHKYFRFYRHWINRSNQFRFQFIRFYYYYCY